MMLQTRGSPSQPHGWICLIFIRNSDLGNDDERKTLSNWTDSYGGKSNARDERVEALIKAMEVSSIDLKADETSRPPVSHLEKFSRALEVIQKEFTERQRKEAEDFGRSLQIVISKQREIESLLRSNMDGDASKEFRMLKEAIGFIPSNASMGVVSALNYMVE